MNDYPQITYHPLTPDRWGDFEGLFGLHGAYGGCWCMYWRLKRLDWTRACGEGNKKAMRQLVESDNVPGILLYRADQVVGWCSVAPREDYPSLNRSPIYRRIDEQQVWSIVCFFIRKEFRGQGYLVELIRSAVNYARRNGAKFVEAYPKDSAEHQHPVNVYMGITSVFLKEGFVEVARRSPKSPILRYQIQT